MTAEVEKWFIKDDAFTFLDDRPWLVRVKDTKRAVGIFCAPLDLLPTLLDEFVDPAACQIAKAAYGGICFENKFPIHDEGLFNTLGKDEFEELCEQEEEISLTDALAYNLYFDPFQWVDLTEALEAEGLIGREE